MNIGGLAEVPILVVLLSRILLRDFPSFLHEHDLSKIERESISSVKGIVSNPLGSDLRGLVTLIIYYIKQFKSSESGKWVKSDATIPKNIYFELKQPKSLTLWSKLSACKP